MPKAQRQQQQPQTQQQQEQPCQEHQKARQRQTPGATSYAQRAATAAPLPQSVYQKIGRNGKAAKQLTGLEPIKCSLLWDERMVVFERAADAPRITPVTATSMIAQVNIALSKVASAHVRNTMGTVSAQGSLSTMAREGASAAMLLQFRREIIETACKADGGVIDVRASENWSELKILVPYARYRHPEGLTELREEIEAENAGVLIPPALIRWMRSKKVIEQHFQQGRLPAGSASVVFKVPGKSVGLKLTEEIGVAGHKFKAQPFVPNKADTLCSRCSEWGH